MCQIIAFNHSQSSNQWSVTCTFVHTISEKIETQCLHNKNAMAHVTSEKMNVWRTNCIENERQTDTTRQQALATVRMAQWSDLHRSLMNRIINIHVSLVGISTHVIGWCSYKDTAFLHWIFLSLSLLLALARCTRDNAIYYGFNKNYMES